MAAATRAARHGTRGSVGRSVKISVWSFDTAYKKKYATVATGTPMTAPSTRRTR